MSEPTLDIEAYLAQHERKELLRFVTVGSVDDGKSTLIGRLLHDSHGIYEDQLSAVKRASKRAGSAGGKIDFALLTDGLRAEREQGITIDVAYRYFSTDKRKFIIADTPGHVQYTRNMATGASTANVAIILIDARYGVLQQSRRHAYIAALLGIPHLAVCVNKMDLVDFDQKAFDDIKAELSQFADKLRFKDVHFLPISAVDGDNVVHPSKRCPWYDDGTLLQYLETVPIAADRNLEDFRYPVQYVLRPDLSYRGFCGRIDSGFVRKGDEVMVLPSRQRSQVQAIDTYDGELEAAFAPMSVTLRLADEVDVSRGDMIVHVDSQPTNAQRFEADLVWLSETPLDVDRSYFLKHTTRMVRAAVDRVDGRIDLETLQPQETKTLELNDIGRAVISCNQMLQLDDYVSNRQSGAFVLIDALSNNTVAAGMVVKALAAPHQQSQQRHRSAISVEQRAKRFEQRAIVVHFGGAPCAGQTAIAFGLERALFEAGHVVTIIDVEAIADGTRSPALMADLAEQCLQVGAIAIFACGLPRAADRNAVRERFEHDELLTVATSPDCSTECSVNPENTAEAVAAIIAALDARGVLKS